MDNINEIIAVNLKALREEQRLSLDALASMTGVSKSMLGMIERGTANPTLATIWKIVNGMKVPFSRFMSRPEGKVEIREIKDITPLLADEDGGYRNYPLFPLDETRPFEVYYIEVDPDVRLCSEPHLPGTQEVVTVFDGTLTLGVGEETHTLHPGAAIRFDANVAHTYHNSGSGMCRLSMVIAYPTTP